MLVIRTIAGALIAIIVFMVAATLTNVFILNMVKSYAGGDVATSHLVRIFLGFFGAGAGIIVAKGVCDAALKIYSGKAIAVFIIIIVLCLWTVIIVNDRATLADKIEFAIESIATVFASVATFWIEDPIAARRKLA